jgi:hypothetical protein
MDGGDFSDDGPSFGAYSENEEDVSDVVFIEYDGPGQSLFEGWEVREFLLLCFFQKIQVTALVWRTLISCSCIFVFLTKPGV